MSRKDYYAILGVPAGESQRGVKSAFRALAQTHHPDRAGAQSTRRFQDILEAYRVLGDRARRTQYDDERRRSMSGVSSAKPRSATDVPPEPFAAPAEPFGDPAEPFGDPAEPFDQRSPRAGGEFGRPPSGSMPRADELASPGSVGDWVLGAFLDGIGGRSSARSRRTDTVVFAVDLSRAEAARGVEVALEVPSGSRCARCDGAGRLWRYRCPHCLGVGRIRGQRVLRARIPPGVTDGATYDLSLVGHGVEDSRVTVVVRVSGHAR